MTKENDWSINIKLNLTEDESKNLYDTFQNWLNLENQYFYTENRYLNPNLTCNLLKQFGFTKIKKRKDGKINATKNNKKFYGLFITDESVKDENNLECTFRFDKIEDKNYDK